MRNYILNLLLLGSVVPLAACSSSADKDIDVQGDTPAVIEQTQSVDALYNEAASALDKEEYIRATRLFQQVEQQYPYSKWATKAQLMAAYAAYQNDSYDEAIFAIKRFIELHPGNDDIDYAYYLKALAYYEQISDVVRDQQMTVEALKSFDALITRFPNSQYTRDSKLKRDLTLDHLAGKEMGIGRYYLKRNQINPAINRFLPGIKEYQTTTHVPEALHRLVEAYLTLGLRDEAVKIAAVLGHNYPGSQWYEDSYKILDSESLQKLIEGRTFIDKTVDSLFKSE